MLRDSEPVDKGQTNQKVQTNQRVEPINRKAIKSIKTGHEPEKTVVPKKIEVPKRNVRRISATKENAMEVATKKFKKARGIFRAHQYEKSLSAARHVVEALCLIKEASAITSKFGTVDHFEDRTIINLITTLKNDCNKRLRQLDNMGFKVAKDSTISEILVVDKKDGFSPPPYMKGANSYLEKDRKVIEAGQREEEAREKAKVYQKKLLPRCSRIGAKMGAAYSSIKAASIELSMKAANAGHGIDKITNQQIIDSIKKDRD